MTNSPFETAAWPVEVTLQSEEKTLTIQFDNGDSFNLPAEFLRVESPSAEVQGHSPLDKKTIAGRRHVGIIKLEPVGNYALRIHFDDLHDSGIFSWQYLFELGQNHQERWNQYLKDLEEKGLSRDP